MRKSKINVLAVFSNPYGTDPLRLQTEERVIRESITLSKHRDNIVLITCPAATIHDISRALLNGVFQVVQISGHGSGHGLILENEQGGQYLVHEPTLAELFHEYASSIQCVILNACYSISQGSLISLGLPFTIAMDGSLNDQAAIEFSRGFYDALGAGKPVDFAYREGCRRIKFALPRTFRLPQLLTQGEIANAQKQDRGNNISATIPERIHFKEGKALVGFTVDLSGSMVESIRNETGGHIRRLEGVRQSLNELIQEARVSIRESQAKHIQTSIDMFVYGFGLRTIPVCDLLSLIRASRQVITKDVVEELTQQYSRKQQDKYKGYEGTSDLMRQLGLDGVAHYVEGIAERYTKAAVRKYIWHEVRIAVEEQLAQIGDTTLPIEEVAQLWEDSEDVLSNVEELIFGNTPVKEVLAEVIKRFEREVQLRDKDTDLILFIVSDGKYSDVDLLLLTEQLRALGVTIISCFITDKDIAYPRVLLNTLIHQREQGAKLLFEMASTMEDDSEVKRFLLHKGWVIYPKAKLVVQVNHSEVLKEFVRVILSLLEDPTDTQALPKGW